jgi:hypothetical protein
LIKLIKTKLRAFHFRMLRNQQFLIAALFKLISFVFIYLIAIFKAIQLEAPQPDWIVISVYWVGVPLYTVVIVLFINWKVNIYKNRLKKT